jgi:YegS/Rv2252/BmrU family lipid kinase
VRRAFVVVNPAAGGGRAARLWPSLREGLRRVGLEFEAAETSGPGSATDLAREAAARGWPLVVAVGGDGTVNEVANGLMAAGGRPTAALGALMTGRGRDACRNLGFAADHAVAVRRLVDGEDVVVDVGAAEAAGAPPRFFVNSAGAGFDAVAATRAQAIRLPGTAPYLLGVLHALREHRPVQAAITIDGRPAWTGAMTMAVVANGPHYGGGMRIAPAARPDDGALDLLIVAGLRRAELLAWLPTVYWGAHLRSAKVTTASGRSLEIATEPAVPVHLDGEPAATTPIRIAVRPGALRVRR